MEKSGAKTTKTDYVIYLKKIHIEKALFHRRPSPPSAIRNVELMENSVS